jgi:NAD(P)-dependent dehydrogenase (short-subunit alcohol dehydrogenase family)
MALNPVQADWRGKNVWLIGASSGIGRATASALHAQGAHVWISARNAGQLDDFVAAHTGSSALPLDVTDPSALHRAASIVQGNAALDLVVYCAGYYRGMRATTFDLEQMLQHDRVNYVGALYMLDAVLPALLRQGHGHISLISSVAGYRGLPQSLAYGPTKAALINLAETLYGDLHEHHVGVSVINPGFVQTPLTGQNDFRMPALITPEQAATQILQGWRRGEFEIHFPKRFTRWMKLLRILPYRVYFAIVRRFTGL